MVEILLEVVRRNDLQKCLHQGPYHPQAQRGTLMDTQAIVRSHVGSFLVETNHPATVRRVVRPERVVSLSLIVPGVNTAGAATERGGPAGYGRNCDSAPDARASSVSNLVGRGQCLVLRRSA
jgi:hypothetical protein